MTKHILIIFVVCSSASSVLAQKDNQPYILDSANIRQIDVFVDALKEKSIGNNLEALKLFNKAIAEMPTNDAALYEASQLDADLNNYTEALAKAEKAYSLNKANKFYLEHYISILTKAGDLDKAIDVLKEVMNKKTADPVVKMQYAYLLGASKNPKKAIGIFEEMERNGEYNEAIAYEKIKLYLSLNDTKGAENELKKMIKNNPGDSRYLSSLAEFYLKSGNLEEAERAFNDILRVEPNNVNALLYKAQYYQMKKDSENYHKTVKSLIENKELNLDTKITLIAERFSQKNKLDSAEKSFLLNLGKQLTAQYPDEYRAHQVLGDMYYLAENYDSAKLSYLKSLSLDNKEFNVWQNLFYTLNIRKEYKLLADSSEAAIELFPAHSLVYFYNATANIQLEKYDKAEKNFRRALRFVGENQPMEAQIHSSLADMYNKQKRFKEMDESFDEAIRLDPDNAYTLNNYAYYLTLRKEKLDLAKKMSKKSLDIDPNNPSFLDTYAWINFETENYTEAKYYQEKALANGKDDMSTIYEHYGDILFKLNDIENALKYWNKAKEAGSKNKTLPTKISTKKYVNYQE